MLFSPKVNVYVRLVSGLLPAGLAVGILYIYVSFFSEALRVVQYSKELNGVKYHVSLGTVAVTSLLLVVVGVLMVHLLCCLKHVVFTDPGSVPGPLVHLHRGLLEKFVERHAFEAPQGRGASARRSLPPQLFGVAGNGGLDMDDEDALFPDSIPAGSGGGGRGSGSSGGGGGASSSPSQHPPFPTTIPLPLGGEVALERVATVPDSVFTRPGPHDPRFCRRSGAVKPPRAHFCSTCNRLVLKQDHHCPWMGNCVGYDNYKGFCLLLFEGWVATALVLAWWGPLAFGWWYPAFPAAGGSASPPPPTSPLSDLDLANAPFWYNRMAQGAIVGFIMDASFLCVLTLFSSMHLWLVLKGRTTLESQVLGGTGREYDFGAVENWRLVFGGGGLRAWVNPATSPDVHRATLWGTAFQRTVGNRGAVMANDYPTKEELANVMEEGGSSSSSRSRNSDGSGGGDIPEVEV